MGGGPGIGAGGGAIDGAPLQVSVMPMLVPHL